MAIVCVTGMHRSGTSIVSRVINLLGVDIGDEEHLMPPNPYNPRGHWENMEVMHVNDAVLEALGGAWDDPPELTPGWEGDEALDPLREEARSVIETQFSSPGLHGWKDPRTSLTMPFWRTVADIGPTVLCVRSPHQVAASLAHRDDIDPERSAYLWRRYTVGALRADPKRLLVLFDNLHSDSFGEVARIAAHIGCPPPDQSVLDAVAEFIDPSLDHHSAVDPTPGPMMEEALALWEMIRDAERVGRVEAELAAMSARRSVRLANKLAELTAPLLRRRGRGGGGEPPRG